MRFRVAEVSIQCDRCETQRRRMHIEQFIERSLRRRAFTGSLQAVV